MAGLKGRANLSALPDWYKLVTNCEHAMRILITLPWGRRLGGAEAMIQTVFDGADQIDHELDLVFFERGPWSEELERAGFDVNVIEAGRLREPHRWLRCVLALARLMRHRRPDLILNWAPKTHLYGAPAAVLAGMSNRVLWWQHGIPTRGWIDRCASALPALAVGCSSQASAHAQREVSTKRATFVVAPGTRPPGVGGQLAALDRAGLAWRTHAERIEPRGAELRGTERTPIVGMVARLEPWKGHDRLLGAQALLRERGRHMHLLMVGGDAYDISPDYARSLPELVQRLDLTDAVTMTGQVPDSGPYIERMDILVNASDREPFGIVLLEAMARGVAVVAVDSGGPAEFIEHERTGMLARSQDPSSLADALEPLLASSARREELGRAGRERFARDFTDVAMRERFFTQMEALAKSGAAG